MTLDPQQKLALWFLFICCVMIAFGNRRRRLK